MRILNVEGCSQPLFSSISGRVYDDFSNDGYTPGEEIAGATLCIETTAIQAFKLPVTRSSKPQPPPVQGLRILDSPPVIAVIQPARSVGTTLVEKISSLLTVSANAVEGQIVETIDNFDLTQQSVLTTPMTVCPSRTLLPRSHWRRTRSLCESAEQQRELSLVLMNPLPNLLLFDSRLQGRSSKFLGMGWMEMHELK